MIAAVSSECQGDDDPITAVSADLWKEFRHLVTVRSRPWLRALWSVIFRTKDGRYVITSWISSFFYRERKNAFHKTLNQRRQL
jgi:hypothetical protein